MWGEAGYVLCVPFCRCGPPLMATQCTFTCLTIWSCQITNFRVYFHIFSCKIRGLFCLFKQVFISIHCGGSCQVVKLACQLCYCGMWVGGGRMHCGVVHGCVVSAWVCQYAYVPCYEGVWVFMVGWWLRYV